MKKIVPVFLLAVFCISATLNAQKSNVIKTSLTSPFLNTFVLAYERVLNEDMGAQVGFYYTGANVLEARFTGFSITPEFRYYLSETRTAPDGAFIAPFLRYQNFSIEDSEASGNGTFTAIGGGLLIGIQRVFKETICLSAFIGPAYVSPTIEYEDPDQQFFNRGDGGFWARAGINIGIMF